MDEKKNGDNNSTFIKMIEDCKLVDINNIPKKCDLNQTPSDNFVLFKLSQKMIEICKEKKGLGLSAFQIGIPLNLFVIYIANKFKVFFDCSYSSQSKKTLSIEGCLSIVEPDGKYILYELERFDKIIVSGWELIIDNFKLKRKQVKFESFYPNSICFQHEIDHGNGILISDIGKKVILNE